MRCPNGHETADGQRFCGQCGVPLAVPWPPPTSPEAPQQWHPPPRPPTASSAPLRAGGLPGPRLAWAAAIGVVVLALVVAGSVWATNRISDAKRWSGFPHTMGCTIDRSESTDPLPSRDPPAPSRVKHVSLAHPEGQLLSMSLHFAQPPKSPVWEYTIGLRGSLGDDAVIIIANNENEWFAARMDSMLDNVMNRIEGNAVADQPILNLLASLVIEGRVATFTIDLSGQPEILGKGPFRPTINIDVLPRNVDSTIFYYSQNCRWDMAVSARDVPTTPLPTPTPLTPTRPQPPPTRPQPQPAAAFPPHIKPCPPKYGETGAYTRSAVGNDQTSCPFAEEVRISYADMGLPGSVQTIRVFSPTTQQLYEVTCRSAGPSIICTGGEGAVVYLK